MHKRTAIFDIETNGLLAALDTIHSLCICIKETGEVFSCTDSAPPGSGYRTIAEGLEVLATADRVVGHNIISFDIPALQKLHPDWAPKGEVFDTLVASLLIWSDMKERDFARRDYIKKREGEKAMNAKWPGSIIGRHGLDAWGIRLGTWKGDYSDARGQELKDAFHAEHMRHREKGLKVIDCPPKAPSRDELAAYVWGGWNKAMQDYCEQDIVVTEKLYDTILAKDYSPIALKLEHDFKRIICAMEREGYCYNKKAAGELERTLMVRQAEIGQELQAAFPPYEKVTTHLAKVGNKTLGRVKGELYEKRETVVFNPGSRPHIADRLTHKYGWKPEKLTETGQPAVDEDVLSGLDYPEAELLAESMMIEKRLGQLANGREAWANHLTPAGRIHHEVVTNGAVTGRCTHKRPNVAQVPKVQIDKVKGILKGGEGGYGFECRSLWGPPAGMKQVGADLSGLELRCLAHYMAPYDGGAYVHTLLEGDVHEANRAAAGLPTRDNAKTFIYGFLYGAGPGKIGAIVGRGEDEGKRLIKSFLDQTPAIKKLRDQIGLLTMPQVWVNRQTVVGGKITTRGEKVPNPKFRGYLIGLDGRRLPIRSSHAALNTLLQSAGAIISKKATVLLCEMAAAKGWVFGEDWALMAHVHDEVQCWARPEIAEELGRTAVAAFEAAGEAFNFKCPITGEFKVGSNWAECH